jgi:hypothetical protein
MADHIEDNLDMVHLVVARWSFLVYNGSIGSNSRLGMDTEAA